MVVFSVVPTAPVEPSQDRKIYDLAGVARGPSLVYCVTLIENHTTKKVQMAVSQKSDDTLTTALPTQVAGVSLPRTELVRLSYEVAHTHYPEWLLNHSLRSYVLGRMLAENDGHVLARPDLMLVGALLHDLPYVGNEFDLPDTPFLRAGGAYAKKFMKQHGQHDADIKVVVDVIEKHIRSGGTPNTLEARAFERGIRVDVIGGQEFDKIEEAKRTQLIERFPRSRFEEQLILTIGDYADRHVGERHIEDTNWIQSVLHYRKTGEVERFVQLLYKNPWRQCLTSAPMGLISRIA